jgi:CheY-like chemotaxis protein
MASRPWQGASRQGTAQPEVQNLDGFPEIAGVIVADDDAIVRDVLRSRLEAIDQVVLLASDGLEAVALAARMQARLILLDLKMPRLNGLDACRRIRLMAHNAKTPIVILTSLTGKDAEAAATQVGATAFLTKPFRSAELLQELSRFLRISDVTRDAITSAAGRAAKIARTAPTEDSVVAKAGPSGALDRGKDILAVLRG